MAELSKNRNPGREPDLPRCFFVCGHPRSGTTALARLLNSSPEIACLFYEGNVLYRLWRMASRRDVLGEPHEDLVTDLETSSRYDLLEKAQKHPEAENICFTEELIARFVEGFRSRLTEAKSSFSLYAETAKDFFRLLSRQSGGYVVGDKVPDYSTIPDILCRAVPQAKMIFIKRDPRATIYSTLKLLESSPHLFAVSNAFAMAYSVVLRNREMTCFKRRTDKVLSVSQAELRRCPEQIAERVCRFLRVSVTEEMKMYAHQMVSDDSKRADEAWKRGMMTDDLAAIEAVFAELDLEMSLHPVVWNRKDGWSEKCDAITPLLSCGTEEIPKWVRHCRSIFPRASDLKMLGATLTVFGDFAHRRARFERAYRFFREAEKMMPGDGLLWFRLGELCYDMKRLKKALAYYKNALHILPDTAYFRFLRAKLLCQCGKVERLNGRDDVATGFFESSLGVFPGFRLSGAMV